jgi:(E)-4-hydroxy-3-methylbut-2-enyl-diphosphate synthase
VGGDAPITVQTMTNTLTSDVKATVEQVQRLRRGRRRHRARLDPRRGRDPRPEGDRARKPVPIVADIHFHYKRGDRGGRGRRGLPADQPRQYRRRDAGEGGHQGRPRPWLRDPDRRERRQPRKAPAGEIWRALSRRDGGIGLDHIRILEDNDFTNFKIS